MTQGNYEESYLGQLRKLVGKRPLIIVTTRAIIQNDQGEVLLVRRSDNGRWVMPAGSLELNETVFEGMQREVREETGLTVIAATLIAINSGPSYAIVTTYDDPYHMVAFVFRVDAWDGELQTETDETTGAQFFPLNALPDNVPDLYHETLADLANFQGQVILK